jgi:hypothetical protein
MGCNDERLGLALPQGAERCLSIEPVVLVVCGGRELRWSARRVQLVLRRMAAGRPVVALLHGGARGADETAGRAAGLLGWGVRVVPANWNKHGRSAGPLRNARMLIEALVLARRCDGTVVVVGLPGGVGTADCLRQAEALRSKGEPLEVRRIIWGTDGLAGEAAETQAPGGSPAGVRPSWRKPDGDLSSGAIARSGLGQRQVVAIRSSSAEAAPHRSQQGWEGAGT